VNLHDLRARAESLDASDPLGSFRDRFVIDDDDLIYLDGNSLGRLPKATVDRLRSLVSTEWGAGLVRSWDEWIDMPQRVGDLLARSVLGAAAGEVVVSDSTTVNLYKLAAAAIAATERRVVLIDEENFTSDHYVIEGLCAATGRQLRRMPAADMAAVVDDDVALAVCSHVAFRTGDLVDAEALTRAAHARGARVVWDLSHSAGVVPIALNDWGADLAVGCTYKHLNGGPGAPAFLYVSERAQRELSPVVRGWFGQRDRFTMTSEFTPAEGATAWLVGTPPVLSLAAAEEGIRLTAEAGIRAIREKSIALTQTLIEAADTALCNLGFEVVTPRDPARRGSHVSLRHPLAWQVCQSLIANERVVPDFREPDVVRLGVAPLYNRYVEMVDSVERIHRIVAAGVHETMPSERRSVT
jgi:kynureninase